jgi:hypothetical protein
VNATLFTSICMDKAAPPTDPREGIVFTTPGGKLVQNWGQKKKLKRSRSRTRLQR